jgi:membrane protease YdiL (CAAX protease family)
MKSLPEELPEQKSGCGFTKIPDEASPNQPSQSLSNNGKTETNGKRSYIAGLLVIAACVYSQYYFQYLGFNLGLIKLLLVYGVPILTITLLCGTAIIRKFFKNTFSAFKYGLGLFGVFTALGILLAIVILFFLILFNPSVIDLLNKPNPELNVSTNFAWVMVALSILVIGPAEEYIFSGFVFGRLQDILKNRHWLTVAFVSSFMFGAMHLYYATVYETASLIQYADLVTFGMAMAGTYYLSGGNLFVPSLIHGVYDATAYIGVATFEDVTVRLRVFMILIGVAVAVAFAIQRSSRKGRIAPT